MDLGTALAFAAARHPDRLAIAGMLRRLTYRQWDARTNQIARALLSLGARPAERIAMLLANTEELASTHLAVQKLAATSTPLNIRLSINELSYCIDDAEPRILVTDDQTGDLARRVISGSEHQPVVMRVGEPDEGEYPFEQVVSGQRDSRPDIAVADNDLSVMLYTSGTTGRPKGVPRTQRNEWAASLAHALQARCVPGECTLGAMPMYHTMGIRSLLSTIVMSGTFVELPAVNIDHALERIEDEQVGSLYLVPTAFHSLHESGRLTEAGRSVRRIGYAGAPMTSTLTGQLAEALQPDVFINHYGSSEIYTFSVEHDAASRPGSAGRAGVNSQLRVVPVDPDAGYAPLAQGDTGEIVASLESDEAFSGYWHRPDADAKSLRAGWYRTGDLGQIDENGNLWVVGRVDDMIITGGENVHPVEVEEILVRSEDVADVAVVGLDHDKWGQAVTAFVVPRHREQPNLSARLRTWIDNDSGLSSYKRPKQVVFVDEIPKSPVGKILRRKLATGEYTTLNTAPDSPDKSYEG